MRSILKTGAKFSNTVSQASICDRHMHSHTHTAWGSKSYPTHHSVVLGQELQKSAKEFSWPRAAADLAKQGSLHILIKASTVQ